MRRLRLFEITALVALTSSAAIAKQSEPSFAGRWQYLQPPDTEGEILDLFVSSGNWRGTMNGLERAGEHGLFYYVTAIENTEVAPDGTIRFNGRLEVSWRLAPASRNLLE